MHSTAITFAIRHSFRLGKDRLGYLLHGKDGSVVARPAWGEQTAAGAVRMMRHQLRVHSSEGRAA